jgi:hypothetical protein
MTRTKRGILTATALVAGLIAAAGPRAEAGAKKKVVWKPVMEALLKLNEHPVKHWNVLQADKNHNLLLVQVSRDWYVFNLKRKLLYRADPNDFEARGENLVGPVPDRNTPRVKTDAWDSHNVGLAQQITVELAKSGDKLTIELAHPLAPY